MIGVLIMNYGSPKSIDGLTSYFTHIMHGHEPSEEMIHEAKLRYIELGVADPLGSVTKRQASAIQSVLSKNTNEQLKVYIGCKHSEPFVEDAVEQMVADGVKYIITLPLTTFYSKTGVGLYEKKVDKKLADLQINIPVLNVKNWHLDSNIIDCFTNRVHTAHTWLSKDVKNDCIVIFTAHSQPGKPETHLTYTTQFEELATSIARNVSLDWRIAYRSAGPQPQLWIGPDVQDVIKEVANEGKQSIIMCDLLSVTENAEVYFDAGVFSQKTANELGIEFLRTPFLNDSYDFISAICDVVESKMHSNSTFNNLLKNFTSINN
ncbi:ferrochelatase [Anaerobacillus alkalidiazotrophicus]|uniref:Ferrochelatase n=1 Tax=Anaerobacillus alkalidiazotrophicus TaxID=472963 RepID=A0A1S2MB07_9BACI|nr:ferrochelatase [Anaerobacillus alkalidiazotrophicus]OIJ20885.1 ferrochelatase [Anaerobacillus alkalidiazotrophicus]